ncbi:hypothetical protein V1511DRAFT_511202 [Dipodascopsis uninucleata]
MFRRSKSKKENDRLSGSSTKLSSENRHDHKQSTGDIADPILTAVREEQPFEVSAHRGGATVSPDMQLRDMFGEVITNPDRSNPTRNRNERPLDTIRAFQYAATGDRRIKETLFRERLGWEDRRFQPSNNSIYDQSLSRNGSGYVDDSENYQNYENMTDAASYSQSRPQQQRAPIQLGNTASGIYENYDEMAVKGKQKKEKRGLFGRKKN